MEKLDRLDWTAGMAGTCFGTRCGIRTNDAAVLERVQEILPPGWRTIGAEAPVVDDLYSLIVGGQGAVPGMRRFHVAYMMDRRIARGHSLDDAIDALESWLRFRVAVRSERRLFVHAGAVGWRGQAILIPGRSMSGKTSLVAALVRQGASYLSDEYAVLDEEGYVHPFAKPLSVRGTDGDHQTRVDVRRLGGRPERRRLPIGLVVVTRYSQPASRWRPRVVPAGQALLELLNHTVRAVALPPGGLKMLRAAATSATTLKGVRGDADDVARRLLRRLDQQIAAQSHAA